MNKYKYNVGVATNMTNWRHWGSWIYIKKVKLNKIISSNK